MNPVWYYPIEDRLQEKSNSMKFSIRTFLFFLILISAAFADKLEIKSDGKDTALPFWPAQNKNYGAVLLLNGSGLAQSDSLLVRLAKQLALNGWNVVLLGDDNKSSVPWSKQLPEALNLLRQQKNMRIVLLHYGDQFNQTLDLLSKPPAPVFEGLILLSAYDSAKPAPQKPDLKMPIFDIVGQFDYDLVKQDMQARQTEFKTNNNNYLTIVIPGAHHDYEYSHQLLFSFIHGWMLKLSKFQSNPEPEMYSYLHGVTSDLQKQTPNTPQHAEYVHK